jgi:hypothetical protein
MAFSLPNQLALCRGTRNVFQERVTDRLPAANMVAAMQQEENDYTLELPCRITDESHASQADE